MLLSKHNSFSIQTFATPLLAWHGLHGRSLPWMTKEPYDVWLSEVMLQQTQVSTVLDRYTSFKKCFPTIRALGSAKVEDVLAQWSGLGYYRRARNLHACAQALVSWLDLHGDWPKESEEWLSFPGIGRSTANAIVSACFNKVVPILDANAKRVLLRFASDLDANDKQAWLHAENAMEVDSSQAAAYTQAIMDLGATICTARKAICGKCPLSTNCKSVGWELKKASKRGVCVLVDEQSLKKSKPVVSFGWALCMRNNGQDILLQQRDESSFWPGLWVLPKMDCRFVPIAPSKTTNMKHELSHRTLLLSAEHVALEGPIQGNEKWVPLSIISERKIPVPSPVAKIVKSV